MLLFALEKRGIKNKTIFAYFLQKEIWKGDTTTNKTDLERGGWAGMEVMKGWEQTGRDGECNSYLNMTSCVFQKKKVVLTLELLNVLHIKQQK